MHRMITANRLSDGVVVFQDGEGRWVESFRAAATFGDDEATAQAMARAKRSEADNEVVEPYAIDLVDRNGHFAPKALREAIRAAGPTVRRDLGKQAHGQAPIPASHAPVESSHVSL